MFNSGGLFLQGRIGEYRPATERCVEAVDDQGEEQENRQDRTGGIPGGKIERENDRSSSVYKKLWDSTSGKVGTLTRFHARKGAELRKRLQAVKPI